MSWSSCCSRYEEGRSHAGTTLNNTGRINTVKYFFWSIISDTVFRLGQFLADQLPEQFLRNGTIYIRLHIFLDPCTLQFVGAPLYHPPLLMYNNSQSRYFFTYFINCAGVNRYRETNMCYSQYGRHTADTVVHICHYKVTSFPFVKQLFSILLKSFQWKFLGHHIFIFEVFKCMAILY
jgi:hypothetical protein